MDSRSPLAWEETSPGILSRSLDEPELYYLTNFKVWEGTGHTTSAITAHIGISLSLSPTEDLATLPTRIERALRYA
jgi:hypothetical protein